VWIQAQLLIRPKYTSLIDLIHDLDWDETFNVILASRRGRELKLGVLMLSTSVLNILALTNKGCYNICGQVRNSKVRFEIFTAVTVKNAVFWDVAPCRSCVNRRFGGTYRLHLQGRKIRKLGTSVSRWLQPPWRWTRYVPPKHRFTQDLHGVASQKTAFFKWWTVFQIAVWEKQLC
jgi:hypothetical protein